MWSFRDVGGGGRRGSHAGAIGAACALPLKSSARMNAASTDAPIFLVGFMATGKTTVGRILAQRLGWTMLDLDDLIAAEAGMTVPDIFAAEGEAGFREREARAVRAAGARRRTVIATGGGAACREDNLRAM